MYELLNKAEQLDRKNIKLTFEPSEVKELKGGFSDFWTCELMDKDYRTDYIVQLIAPTQQETESMRDNVLFGLNHRAKLEAENEALRNKVSQQQNEIDKLKQR